jgi:DNA-binding NarL/FixJ family response regulator
VYVAVEEPLIVDSIANAVEATADLKLLGKSSDHKDILDTILGMKPDVVIVGRDLFENPPEAMKDFRKSSATTSLIMIANSITPDCWLRCMSGGIKGCLLKKATAGEIANAIRCVSQGNYVIDSRIAEEITCQLRHILNSWHYLKSTNHLAPRELEVLRLASEGLTNREIGRKLFISERTVQSHFSAVFAKLGARSRTEAVSSALKKDLFRSRDTG